MDAGVTLDPYIPTALVTQVPFRIQVIVDGVTYLPIEMAGDFSFLGEPAKRTQLDLTLGVDSDGDGLPDAWEETLIQMLGLNGLADVNPGDDADGDGVTNLDEYLSGNFAFDVNDGLVVGLAGFNQNNPVLEFLAIRGRTYYVLESSDLLVWTQVSFLVPTEGANPTLREYYQATSARTAQIEVPPGPETDAKRYFKLMVQ